MYSGTPGAGSLEESAPTNCSWELQVKNDKFTILKPPGAKTTYWTGKLVGASVAPTTTSSPS